MSRYAAFCAVFMAGAIIATLSFFLIQQRQTREATFGSLAHHTRIALEASSASPAIRAIVADSLNNDLRLVFMRYESFSSDERALLQLIAQRAAAGAIALAPDVASHMRQYREA